MEYLARVDNKESLCACLLDFNLGTLIARFCVGYRKQISCILLRVVLDASVKPPNAMATPTIACRRVGQLVGAAKLFLLLIIVLPISCFRLPPQKNTL